jgi:hypothetical protein
MTDTYSRMTDPVPGPKWISFRAALPRELKDSVKIYQLKNRDRLRDFNRALGEIVEIYFREHPV